MHMTKLLEIATYRSYHLFALIVPRHDQRILYTKFITGLFFLFLL